MLFFAQVLIRSLKYQSPESIRHWKTISFLRYIFIRMFLLIGTLLGRGKNKTHCPKTNEILHRRLNAIRNHLSYVRCTHDIKLDWCAFTIWFVFCQELGCVYCLLFEAMHSKDCTLYTHNGWFLFGIHHICNILHWIERGEEW